MKINTTFKSMLIACMASFLLVVACETKNKMDSNELAEEKNEDKFDDKAEKNADFVAEVAKSNLSEIKLSRLAADRAKSNDVKEFANMMIEQHKMLYSENADYAKKNNISYADTIAGNDISGYDALMKEKGSDFDKKYINTMVDDHKNTIDKFEEVSTSDKYSKEVASMATAALPKIRMHYDKAKNIQAMMENKK